jgi:hypothetical protein
LPASGPFFTPFARHPQKLFLQRPKRSFHSRTPGIQHDITGWAQTILIESKYLPEATLDLIPLHRPSDFPRNSQTQTTVLQVIQQKVGIEERTFELLSPRVNLEELSTFPNPFFPAKTMITATHSPTAFFFPWHAFVAGRPVPLSIASLPGNHASCAGDDYSVEKSFS